MLSQKRSSRIDAKQKKLLAMLEEETVIESKPVLVGYKKLEVCILISQTCYIIIRLLTCVPAVK